VSGLAHYFERAGIPAVAISLIREHTRRMRSPRALAVPFELGKPFGAANQPDFQRRVLLSALKLLERNDGPILEDFPDEPPAAADTDEGWACPVDFSSGAKAEDPIKSEMALLTPWYEEAKRKARGRRLDGLTNLPRETLIDFLRAFRDDPAAPSPLPGVPGARAVKLASDDLKHFYYQAALAKPGAIRDVQLADWFFGDTRMGNLFLEIKARYAQSDNEVLQRLATLQLVPSHQGHRKPRE
jgi:hypothetical protein